MTLARRGSRGNAANFLPTDVNCHRAETYDAEKNAINAEITASCTKSLKNSLQTGVNPFSALTLLVVGCETQNASVL